MRNWRFGLVTLTVSVLVLAASLLLIAQAKKAPKAVKHAASKAAAPPPPPPHPWGPTHIHVNFGDCELQEPMVHADPASANGSVVFSQINGTADITVDIAPSGFLVQDHVTVPQHGEQSVPVNVQSGTGTITINGCTPPQPPNGKRATNDPNEILVP